jgi:two-component system response regulator BaeR
MNEKQARVLVVEDEERIAEALCAYLHQSGFATTHIANGSEVLPWLHNADTDLVLLDVMLPGRDGLSILKEIRQEWPSLPVLMLTARIEEIDRLLGLELGADDYICKPFSPREVVARVRTVLRRSQPAPVATPAPVRNTSKLLRAGPVSLDRERFEVQVNQQPLALTPKEFLLLDALAVHPGAVLTRAQLLDQVYADDNDVSDRVIDSHMKNLRRKINQLLPEKELIQAVYGIGYKLVL